MKRLLPLQRFLQTMRAIQGSMIVSSSVQIILGYSQLWGICTRFFSPLGMVPVVSLVGFGLFERGFTLVNANFQFSENSKDCHLKIFRYVSGWKLR